MRWIWLDRIVMLERGRRCVAIRNVTAAEEAVWSNAEVMGCAPFMPHSLIVEGFAQTAGILVGHANDFKEKVILAKVGKAVFTDALATPGTTLRYDAAIDRIDASGALTSGTVTLTDAADGSVRPLADIEMMFSHIDQNMQGLEFPEENFVFTEQFMDLLRRSGVPVG
jgi:3-hydroxyacyl-[acyl-carrier-protein] dehydratase